MKSYTDFLLERAFSERGQAAREKMRAQAGLNAARNAADRQQQAAKVGVTAPSKQKALPPGRTSPPKTPTQAAQATAPKGAPLAKRAADKGSALVRSKGYKEPRAERPDEKQSRIAPGISDMADKQRKRIYNNKMSDREKKGLNNIGKGIQKTAGKTFSSLMKQRKPNAESGNQSVETSSHSGQIS